ncbi:MULTISPECIES: alpha/beta hydrolase family protein [Alteromonadaceae]|uniref:alpha/beta hydrolase family protein n=1 Tax=Alteromonadaceae TaxID=72275 RepID=UPI001C0854D0|nr:MULTISPECIES: hypothetical protein [Aliiglaciecola]MBU2877618.1 hypothetical protein [Aliiglaciecola lipolytica]MDO6711193.1 hypothetical protein [Aliiglaciecola sp. 2_MG-2023]MDO6752107.1 hypothetical protein [Aliiglaciecola sp. 1_MG-2023]
MSLSITAHTKTINAFIVCALGALFWLAAPSAFGQNQQPNGPAFTAQMSKVDLFDKSRQRPIKVTVWFPSEQIAVCEKAPICIDKRGHKNKVFVFSHGAMGDPMGYNWIGYALASQGFTVLAPSHFGESWIYGPDNIDPQAALRMWDRSLDISYVLNQFSSAEYLSEQLNFNNVTAIGHSSGGFTSLALAGATLGKDMTQYCQSTAAQKDLSCQYAKLSEAKNDKETLLSASYKDERITAVIAFDPALGPSADVESVSEISVPVLLIAPLNNDFLDFAGHAGFYHQQLQNSRLVSLQNNEGHFVFLDSCKHTHKAMGVSLCKDRVGVDREAVHRQLYADIFGFIFRS